MRNAHALIVRVIRRIVRPLFLADGDTTPTVHISYKHPRPLCRLCTNCIYTTFNEVTYSTYFLFSIYSTKYSSYKLSLLKNTRLITQKTWTWSWRISHPVKNSWRRECRKPQLFFQNRRKPYQASICHSPTIISLFFPTLICIFSQIYLGIKACQVEKKSSLAGVEVQYNIYSSLYFSRWSKLGTILFQHW